MKLSGLSKMALVFAVLRIFERKVNRRAKIMLLRHINDLENTIAVLALDNERLREVDCIKSRFIADATHQLRTPLASLKLRLYMLECGKPERRAEYLADAKSQLDKLAQLSEELLNLAWLESVGDQEGLESVDLNAVVRQVVNTLRPLAETAGLELAVDCVPDLPPVWGRYGQLVQMGSNLVGNAIHYTPAGQVMIATTYSRERQQACLTVKDTGIGIAEDDLPHLFERFYRSHHVKEQDIPGNGLGLSIVKEIVDLHHGQIEVMSQPGEGSVFSVYLPLEENEA